MATKTPQKAPRAAKTTAPTLAVPETATEAAAGSEAAAEHFRAAALKLSPKEVIPLRADALLALHNAYAGVDAVLAERDALKADPEAPRPDWDALGQVKPLAAAVVFTAKQVSSPVLAKQLRAELAEAYALRELFITDAKTLGLRGLLPPKKVADIIKGQGSVDAAHDCVALAALYRANAQALRGKTSVTAAEVRRAAELGSSLLERLTPKTARTKTPVDATHAAATDLRDRMWTLLVRGYERVQRVGAWRWVGDVGEHVPSLQSRRVARRTKAEPAPKAEPKG